MNSRTRGVGNYVGWVRGSSGYLKKCKECGRTIYLYLNEHGKWRAYSSWVAQDVAEGEWEQHLCTWAISEAKGFSSLSEPRRKEKGWKVISGKKKKLIKKRPPNHR